MKSDCEITGATIVSTHGTFRGSIAIHDGHIVGLLAEPTGTAGHTIDATGLVALPGMVDQHVHFMDPGPTAREDFPHGSAAATRLRSTPTPSTSISTSSPTWIGAMPAGVPVAITSPGSSTMNCDR